ncbi:uncharacterized protein LOC113231677 [Hyposmocoma kahamanoa]|uniref:uncharacterized protein LOC113231677 n=1 Tax=Hyposmocoma kahamanoa TaxID=1477025 RepID=UPI000E6D802C|nr:uncharacterized protein LOC113231677 [Hyposmocoma kahamanoa]
MNTTMKPVQCDGYKRNVCVQCSNSKSSEVRVMELKGKRTLLYLCPAFRVALFQVPKLIKSYGGLCGLDEAKKRLLKTTNIASPEVSVVNTSPSDTNAIMEEILERERRASNVILVGIKKCISENGSDRKTHDESTVKKLLLDMNSGGDCSHKVMTVQRLGRRENGKTRPIKVVLSSRQDAVWILKNKSKAKMEVRIYDDKTPKQREQLRDS